MSRPISKTQEAPMDIVAGNIAGLMRRRKISEHQMKDMLGMTDIRTFTNRLNDPSKFTGDDLNHICAIFDVTLEQLAHDGMK